jgi:AhpD family alkylhydroperoxidase
LRRGSVEGIESPHSSIAGCGKNEIWVRPFSQQLIRYKGQLIFKDAVFVTDTKLARSEKFPNGDQKPPGFLRRYYRGWKPFWTDLKFLLSRRKQIKAAMNSEMVTSAFRERLMLAVTEVNQCSYCRKFHIGQAKQAGISVDEVSAYLKGTIPESVPEDQKLAVCYAQHWAESDGEPDPDFRDEVMRVYGQRGFKEITMVLYLIRMGNLLGNTLDYFLYRISRGRWRRG